MSTERRAGRTAVSLLGVALILHVMLSVGYVYRTPVFEGPDESDHFTYASYIAQAGRLPMARGFGNKAGGGVLDEESMAHHPPLYYWLVAQTMRLVGHGSLIAAKRLNPDCNLDERPASHLVWVHGHDERDPVSAEVSIYRGLRVWSVLFGVGSLLLIWKTGRLLFPSRPLAVATGVLLLACLPMWSFMHGVVNNDNLATLLSHAVLYLLVRSSVEQRLSPARGAGLGVLLGAALLTKVTCFFLMPLVALAYGVALLRSWQSRVTLLRSALVCLLLTFLIAAWFYLRNMELYGDLFGKAAHDQVFGAARVPEGDQWAWLFGGFARLLPTSFVGNFGWMNLPLPLFVHVSYALLGVAALIGVAMRSSAQSASRLGTWILILATAGVFTFVVRYNLEFRQPQGRLLFPAVGAIALCTGLGLANLVNRLSWTWRRFSVLWVALPTGLSFWILAGWFAPQFDAALTQSDPYKASLVRDVAEQGKAQGIELVSPADGAELSEPPLLRWRSNGSRQRGPAAVYSVQFFTAEGRVLMDAHASGDMLLQGEQARMPAEFFMLLPAGKEVLWRVRQVPNRERLEKTNAMPRSQSFRLTRR